MGGGGERSVSLLSGRTRQRTDRQQEQLLRFSEVNSGVQGGRDEVVPGAGEKVQ